MAWLRMAGLLRAFLFAPSPREHERHAKVVSAFLPHLSDAAVLEAAYRHEGARQTAFAFAQGAVVGALGNLFASSLGHWIDRGFMGPMTGADVAWTVVGIASIAVIASTTWGALRRFRLNGSIERLLQQDLRRRGGAVAEAALDLEDDDDLPPP